MSVRITNRTDKEITIEMTFSLAGSMLSIEDQIQKKLNEAGCFATEFALQSFDTNGAPIEHNGVKQQIEVRTKGRNVDPKPDYECCTDCIKPHFIYIFVSLNKKADTVSVLGVANWDNFSKHAIVTNKGSTNDNFTNKVNEFNIKIEHLTPLEEYF